MLLLRCRCEVHLRGWIDHLVQIEHIKLRRMMRHCLLLLITICIILHIHLLNANAIQIEPRNDNIIWRNRWWNGILHRLLLLLTLMAIATIRLTIIAYIGTRCLLEGQIGWKYRLLLWLLLSILFILLLGIVWIIKMRSAKCR